MKAEWSEGAIVRSADVTSSIQARTLISELANSLKEPTMVEFCEDNGRAIAIGIGREQAVVTYQDSLDPPYYISEGDMSRTGCISYLYGGEETEYLLGNAINMSLALNAIDAFFEFPSLFKGMKWEKL